MSGVTASAITIKPASHVRGRLRVSGDKSISHRYAILAALADGTSTIHEYSPGADCGTTLECLRRLGVEIVRSSVPTADRNTLAVITGRGLIGLQPSDRPLDAGNSGTTMRLLAGVLAAHPFATTITGDKSLCRRPMERVVEPLEQMGAQVETHGGRPPLTIHGRPLQGIKYEPPVASAQVKSAILLAGLNASGRTLVRERVQTRDHTERALTAFGLDVRCDNSQVSVHGGQQLRATNLRVPGDLSSAAFWAVAAAALPGSEIEIFGVGLNPTRSAFLDVLRRAGADVDVEITDTAGGEPLGTLRVRHCRLDPITIGPDEVSALIDEIPALAALATHGGEFELSGASELRKKESDRIAVLANSFAKMGAEVDERQDGLHLRAPQGLTGGTVDAAGDHRMVMAFAIAALGATKPSIITGAEAVDVSYPGFFATLDSIRC